MNIMAKPITPSEVTAAKAAALPDFVLDAFNECIAEAWDGSSARVMQPKVRGRIRSKMGDRRFDIAWLDVEPIYRKAGWIVTYDAPGYCETYEAFFEFRARR